MTRRPSLAYALITPARDEAENLLRLGECVTGQTVLPSAWILVDNGSSDGTPGIAEALARNHDWIRVISTAPTPAAQPGEPIVRAFHAGLALLNPVDVVVKLDADVSLEPNYFERLLAEFAADPTLGIASGQCYERRLGEWRPEHVTGFHVRGLARAWRWGCLQAVLPLDGTVPCVMDVVDELEANALGWTTRVLPDLSVYHHRSLGERDGAGVRWARQGRAAHYLGYRFSYLVIRTSFRSLKDPTALAMISSYLGAALRGEPRSSKSIVPEQVRRQQRLRYLPVRGREALGLQRTQSRRPILTYASAGHSFSARATAIVAGHGLYGLACRLLDFVSGLF